MKIHVPECKYCLRLIPCPNLSVSEIAIISYRRVSYDRSCPVVDSWLCWASPAPRAWRHTMFFVLFLTFEALSHLLPLVKHSCWKLKKCTGFLLGWNFFRTICPGCQRSTGHLQFLQDNFSWTINWNLKVRLIVVKKHITLMAKSGNV